MLNGMLQRRYARLGTRIYWPMQRTRLSLSRKSLSQKRKPFTGRLPINQRLLGIRPDNCVPFDA